MLGFMLQSLMASASDEGTSGTFDFGGFMNEEDLILRLSPETARSMARL